MNMRDLKFRITYQHGETGRMTERIILLGETIPALGIPWSVISKDQFTGFHDRDIKDIYESDIIETIRKTHLVITWHNFAFYFAKRICACGKHGLHYYPTVKEFRSCKVIGNIYENAELLKECNDL